MVRLGAYPSEAFTICKTVVEVVLILVSYSGVDDAGLLKGRR